jgi:hypothetical protein
MPVPYFGEIFNLLGKYVASMAECMIKLGGLGIIDDEKCCIKQFYHPNK